MQSVGLPALQALPLLGYLSARLGHTGTAVPWALAGACGYALLFVAVTIWTARGSAVVAWAAAGWWWLATPGLVYALAVLRMATAAGQPPTGAAPAGSATSSHPAARKSAGSGGRPA